MGGSRLDKGTVVLATSLQYNSQPRNYTLTSPDHGGIRFMLRPQDRLRLFFEEAHRRFTLPRGSEGKPDKVYVPVVVRESFGRTAYAVELMPPPEVDHVYYIDEDMIIPDLTLVERMDGARREDTILVRSDFMDLTFFGMLIPSLQGKRYEDYVYHGLTKTDGSEWLKKVAMGNHRPSVSLIRDYAEERGIRAKNRLTLEEIAAIRESLKEEDAPSGFWWDFEPAA